MSDKPVQADQPKPKAKAKPKPATDAEPRAVLVLDCDCNPANAPAYLKPAIKFKPHKRRGKPPVPYFPTGTEFVGDQAVFLCRTGQGAPVNDVCRERAAMTDAQSQRQQLEYKMNSLGINRKEDRELYEAGVIDGYDDSNNYIKGPNWDEYHKAVKEAEELEGDI